MEGKMKGGKILISNIVLALLAVTNCFSVKAQYDITIEIKNFKTDTLLMGYFWHGGPYALDTSVNSNGKFAFRKKNKTLEDGIYFFSDTKGRYCEFLICKDQNLKFKTSDEDWIKNMKVKGSKNEEVYFDYLVKSDDLGKQYQLAVGNRESISKQEYEDKVKILTERNDSLKNDFIKNYPDHILSKILLCTQPLNVPEFPIIYKEDGSVDSVAVQHERFCWYKLHYFDNIDFGCGALLNTHKKIFMDNYERYWQEVMKYEKADSILYYAEYWINKATDKKMFEFLVKDITTRYLQSPVMGHDKVYVGMVDKYLKTGKYTALTPSDIDANIQRADTWRNLLIGKTVPDLACPENDDKSAWHHLDELQSKYKILVFWSIECGHCTTEIPKLNEFYKAYHKIYDLEVFAVHTEGDTKARDEFIENNGITWINTNGLFASYDWREYFNIEKTPVVYILDSYDKILAKHIPIDNLKQVMDVLERGGFDL
ncbi:MAG: redoxin domain-containing protein [Bacteroidales bacterium]|nr:redoxin domain-containing protein [Bacteroidales bacterium]